MKHLILLVLCLGLAACAPKHIDPPLFFHETQIQSLLAANLHAKDVGGSAFYVLNTHSMEPVLFGGDYVVVAPEPYSGLVAGKVVTYWADWAPKGSRKRHPSTGT